MTIPRRAFDKITEWWKLALPAYVPAPRIDWHTLSYSGDKVIAAWWDHSSTPLMWDPDGRCRETPACLENEEAAIREYYRPAPPKPRTVTFTSWVGEEFFQGNGPHNGYIVQEDTPPGYPGFVKASLTFTEIL